MLDDLDVLETNDEDFSMDEEDNNNGKIVVRGKWLFEGCSDLDEIVETLENYIIFIKGLQERGFELIDPVEDDYGFAIAES